jgi:glyoxylase-like metal-dependent hydrolase (beta-lactamase superfamily II)
VEINTYISKFLDVNSYVVDGKILIDPALNYKDLRKYSDLEAIFLTHGHIDHIINIESYMHLPNLKFYMHKEAYQKLLSGDKNLSSFTSKSLIFNIPIERIVFIHDNMILEVAGLKIKIMETPGHSNCSVCLLIDDIMFSGDTLFNGTVGRTDLYSSNSSLMLKSIERLKKLKIDYKVYPGHGEETSLSLEKLNNPYFKKKGIYVRNN